MGAICSLEQNEKLANSLGTYLHIKMQESVEGGKPFKLSNVMKEIYDISYKKNKDDVKSLGIAGAIPSLFFDIQMKKPILFNSILKSGTDINAIVTLSGEINSSDDPTKVVAEFIEKGGIAGISELIANDINNTVTEKKVTKLTPTKGPILDLKLLMPTLTSSTGVSQVTRNGANVIFESDPLKRASYNALQNIVAALEKSDVSSYESLEYDNHVGFKLRAVVEKNLPSPEKNIYDEDKASNATVVAITDIDGNYLYFDDNGRIVPEESGKIAYFRLRKLEDKDAIIEAGKNALARLYKVGKDQIPEEDVRFLVNQIEKEATELSNIKKDAADPNKKVMLDIVDGKVGFIDKNQYQENKSLSKFTKTPTEINTIGELRNFTKTTKGGGSYEVTLPSITFDNGITVELMGYKIKKTTPELFNNLINLLVDDLVRPDGTVVKPSEKIALFKQFFFPLGEDSTPKENKLRMFEKNDQLVMSIGNDIINTDNKEEARKKLEEFLDLSGYHSYIKRPGVSYISFNIENGILYTEEKNYNDFIFDNVYPNIVLDINTGRPMVSNGYFNFSRAIDQEQLNAFTKSSTDKANKITKKLKIDDWSTDDLLERSKAIEDRFTPEQLRRADAWAAATPLFKIQVDGKPVITLQDALNIVNSDAFATFANATITMYKGANSTHLYHEAWHAFSQIFLKKAERTKLYKAAATLDTKFTYVKKSGTGGGQFQEVVTVNLNTLDPNNKQDRKILEEFTAEEYRIYAMNGGKFLVEDEKANIFKKIFNKIWALLKGLFTGESLTSVYSNPGSAPIFNEMFSALYNAKTEEDLIMFQPSIKNAEFGTLNSGSIKDEDGNIALNDIQSQLISKSIDGLIGQISNQLTMDRSIYGANLVIFSNKKALTKLYNQTIKQALVDRLNEMVAEYEANSDMYTDIENDYHINNIDTLTKALENYGDITNILNNTSDKESVIAYHIKNSAFKDKILSAAKDPTDIGDTNVLEVLARNDKSSNEFKAEEIASQNAIYLIESLLQEEYQDNKRSRTYKVNKLGLPQVIDFQPFWNFLLNKVSGVKNETELYNALVELSNKKILPEVEQLVERLGQPEKMLTSRKAARMWLGMIRSLNLAPINLVNNVFEETIVEKESSTGEIFKFATLDVTSGKIVADYTNIKNNVWNNRFNIDVSPYIFVNNDKQNQLDLNKIIDRFITKYIDSNNVVKYKLNDTIKPGQEVIKSNDPIEFLNAIGLYMSDTIDIRANLDFYGINQLANAIGQANFNQLPVTNPVSFFSQSKNLNYQRSENGVISTANNKLKVESNATIVNNLATLEAQYSTSYGSQMIPLPSGDGVKSRFSMNSSTSKIEHAINSVSNVKELDDPNNENGYVPTYSKERNPAVMGSIYRKSLFDSTTGEKVKDNSLTLEELVGSQYKNATGVTEGLSHDQMNENDKFLSDLIGYLTAGNIEAVRSGEKSTYLSLKVAKIVTDALYDKKSNHLFFDTEDFVKDQYGNYITKNNINRIIKDVMFTKLEGELRRIKKLNEGISPEQAQALGLNPEDAKDFYKKNVKGFSNINMLDWFDEILDSKEFGNELKEDLINNYSKMLNDTNNLNSLLLSTDEGKELKTQIEKQIFDYFNTLANEFKTQNYIPLFGNKVPDFLIKLATKKLTELQKREVTPEQAIDALMMSFAVNTALHSDEIITLVFGDGLQFNHKKAESTKRVPTYNSPGITFSTGNLSVAAINKFYSRGYEQKLIDQGVITDRKEPRTFSKIGQKAVIKDPVVATPRYKQYNDMFYNVLIKRNYTEDQVKELLYGTGDFNNPGKDSIMHTWKNISKADGQGYITLDYYRMLKANEDKWTEKQEELYQKIINDEYVPAGDIEDIFPVYKLLHAGPLSLPEGMYPIESIDKFSLLPLIPSLIKGGTNLEVIHKEMIKQGVDYIVFDSGAKRSYIKSGETNGDDIFEGNDTRKLKPNFKFTKNPFHVEYLRNVTEVNNFFKGKSTFATQFRKLFDVTLYEKGVPVDFKGTKAEWDALSETEKQKSEVYRTTEAALNSALRLQDYLKLELYEEFGYDIEDGKPVMSDQTKIDMIDYLKKKLLEQGYTEHELEAFDTEGPDFEVDLSTSPVAARLEKFMFSIINNKLVRLKVNGEPLVQVSNSFFHKFTRPTEEETKKYDDFEENAGYIVDPLGIQKTIGVKVKIALTENYENLYKTKYFVKNKEGEWEAKGTVGVYDKVYDENKNFIGKKLNHEKSFGRLNEMLRVDAWLKSDNNAKKIQLTGVRIPVQGGNSAEFAQIWEFLPPAAGTIIIIPAEVVAKSGGDFDVDKLTMYLKYITKQGTLIEDTYKDPKEITAKIAQLKQKIKDLKETKKQLKDVEDLFILDSLADFRSAIRKTFGRLPFTDEQKEALVNKDDKTLLETLNKKAIKKLLERFSKRSKPAYKIFKTQIEKFDVSKFDEVKATIDNLDEKSAELNNLYNQISDLYEHKRNFASGIQNTFIDNIIKTLELPQMAFSLLLPNGTYLAKPFADDLEGIIRDLDGQRDYKKSLMTGKDRGTESPSVLRNYNYNLKKQQDNKAGKSILGPIVLEIPANNLLNKAGAMLNPYVIEEVTVGNKVVSLTTPITLELKHNYTIEKVKVKDAIREIKRISMSELLDADKTNQIADVLSQLTNGAVDVGKDAWIAFLQGNLVAIPKILFLLEAGVPIGDVAYFMNNPYIRKFIKVEQKAKSKLAKVFYGVNHKPYKVIGDYVSNIVDDVIKRTNPDGWFSGAYKTLWGKHALLKAYIDKNNLIERETFEREGLKSVAKNEANTDEKAIAGFLQYMYILELTKEHDELKKLIDVDNNTSGDNSEAEAKIAQIENAKANFRFYDKKLIDFMKNESIISSFYIQEEATNLFGENFFSFRANKNLQSFIREYISNWQLMNMIKTRTGLTEDNFANRFKNALSLYVFTNALKPYNPKVDHYKGKRLTDLVNPGSYIKSIDQLRDDFKNKLFLPTNKTETGYLARGLYPIPDNRLVNYSEDDFIELSLEREYLRKYVMPYTDILLMSSEFKYDKRRLLKDMPSLLSTMSDEKINKLVYENMLLNKALLNTYNNYQMFSSDQNTVARKLLQIVNTYGKDLNPVYGDLLERFEFPTTEAKDNQGKRINFKLKSNTTLSKEEQTHFNKLWKELADPSVHKLTDTSEVGMAANKYISDFFSQLSLFAFLQSGMDSSKFNMNNVIPTDKYKPIMDEAAKEFTEKVLRDTLKSEKFLKGFLNMFLAINDISLNGGTYDMKGKGLSYKGNINSIIKSGAELLGEPLEKSDVELNRRVTEISRELASEEPTTVQAKLLSDDDVSRFRAELEKSAGKLPTVFYASNRDYRIFYNDQTGVVQGNPEENMWVLNEKSLYDLLDPETGEVYLKDVDLQTGYQSIPENQLNERNEILKDGGRDFNPGPVIIPFVSTTAPTSTQTTTSSNLPGPETKINIYAGTGENAELSNFANRPFKLGDGDTYPTVEHAFQLEKLQYSNIYTHNQIEAIVKDMNTKSAAQVKAFGQTIKGLDRKRWDEDASIIMKMLIKSSFEQNPDALAKLLATGNATLTHMYKGVEQDKGRFSRLLMEVRNELRATQPQKTEPSKVKVISPDYGVVQVETNPTKADTQEVINLIAPQIEKQAYKENVGVNANWQFSFGNMWSRVNLKAKPLLINSFAGVNKVKAQIEELKKTGKVVDKSKYIYDYHELDQDGNSLPPISDLQPLINKIQNALGIDMSGYDSVLGNIYLDKQSIAPHRDTTEAKSAEGYPVIVYTIGNDSGLGIWDDNKGKITFQGAYKEDYQGRKPTNEILTKDGTVYTFGMDGKGRFALSHTTPLGNIKKNPFPAIKLSDGRTLTNYTITLTFRRAADLEPGMPKTPAKLGTQPQASTTDKFSKKNIFTVTPQQGVVDNKAVIKASIATQYIGFGEDIVGKDAKRSTTQIYREQAGKYANTGNYSASDVIFVSVPGLRGDASIAKREQDKTINEAIKAVEAGATILTDNKAYTDASSYNTGEKRLYKNMEAKGYNYSEITVDGQVIGTWSKTQPQAGAGNFEQLYNAEERITILATLRQKHKDDYKDLSDVQLVQRINNRLMTQDRDITIEILNKCFKK